MQHANTGPGYCELLRQTKCQQCHATCTSLWSMLICIMVYHRKSSIKPEVCGQWTGCCCESKQSYHKLKRHLKLCSTCLTKVLITASEVWLKLANSLSTSRQHCTEVGPEFMPFRKRNVVCRTTAADKCELTGCLVGCQY